MSAPVLILVTDPVIRATGERTHGDGSRPGFVRADPGVPQLSVFDLGVTRADGVFETVMVAEGRAPALDAHLERFRSSAALLELPEPDPVVWRAAFAAAVDAHPPVPLLSVKLVLTRGIEGSGRPSAWLVAQPAPDFTELRVAGLHAITLDRGYRHDVGTTSPWLAQGAKTLSYEVNSAALREARRRGAGDAIFVSSDGFVLEATTSSVLLRDGDRFLTPAAEGGIVPGTTARRVFELLRADGFEADAVRLRASELQRAGGLWLMSSIRRVVPVISLDGAELPITPELTARLNERLG